jgi:hydrogenase expression/formation protein HypC
MCLAIPGRIVDFHDNLGMRMSKIDYGGIMREACMDYIPDARIGEYVLVHVGFAISRVDEAEAHRTLQYLEELGELRELHEEAAAAGADEEET